MKLRLILPGGEFCFLEEQDVVAPSSEVVGRAHLVDNSTQIYIYRFKVKGCAHPNYATSNDNSVGMGGQAGAGAEGKG